LRPQGSDDLLSISIEKYEEDSGIRLKTVKGDLDQIIWIEAFLSVYCLMKTKDNVGTRVSKDLQGTGEISDEMIEQRAKQVALLKSRPASEYTEEDWKQAKEELLHPETISALSEQELLEKIPAWDEPPTETGRKIPDQRPEDDALAPEILVNQGVREAEHDRMVEGHKKESVE
jgi:hypothetical protein